MMSITGAASPAEADPKAELAKKLEEVRRINDLCSEQKTASLTIAGVNFWVWFVTWTICTFIMFSLTSLYMPADLGAFRASAFVGFAIGLVPVVVSFTVASLVTKSLPGQSPINAQILALLGQYDPVDRSAYQLLQKQTREAGNLKVDNVKAWAEAETDAIQCGSLGEEADVFLNKKV